MSAFVKKETGKHTFKNPDTGKENAVYYNAGRMSLRDEAAMQKELFEMQLSPTSGQDTAVMRLSPLDQKLVILKYNLKRWQGDWFQDHEGNPVKYSYQALGNLDFDHNAFWIDPLIEKLNEINTPAAAEPDESDPDDDFLAEESAN